MLHFGQRYVSMFGKPMVQVAFEVPSAVHAAMDLGAIACREHDNFVDRVDGCSQGVQDVFDAVIWNADAASQIYPGRAVI